MTIILGALAPMMLAGAASLQVDPISVLPEAPQPRDAIYVAVAASECVDLAHPGFPARLASQPDPGDPGLQQVRIEIQAIAIPGRVCPAVLPQVARAAIELPPLDPGLRYRFEVELVARQADGSEISRLLRHFDRATTPGPRFASGAYFDPRHPGHGLTLLQPAASLPLRIGLIWNTFDLTGQAFWLSAVGPEPGPTGSALRFLAQRHAGLRFGEFERLDHQAEIWGELSVEYLGCERLRLEWVPLASLWPSGGSDMVLALGAAGNPPCRPPSGWQRIPLHTE